MEPRPRSIWRRGVSRVVIFERWYAGGRSHGPLERRVSRVLHEHVPRDRAARDSIAMMERFREITGVDAGFRRTGMLFLHPP